MSSARANQVREGALKTLEMWVAECSEVTAACSQRSSIWSGQSGQTARANAETILRALAEVLHPKPISPRDVLNHQCIRFRHRGESVYKWELDKGDESLAIAVTSSLLLDELDLVIQAAVDGAGLAWVAEDRVTAHLASGALMRVLEDWWPPFPGFFLYYPSRRQRPAALSALSTRSDGRRASGVSDSKTFEV